MMRDIKLASVLKSKINPTGVAEHQLQAQLPLELKKGKLTSAKQFERDIR